MAVKIKLKNVRTSFFDGYVAKEFKTGDGKPRYSCSFLIEKGSANDKAVRQAIKEAAAETFEKKAEGLLKSWESNSNKFCYSDGDTKDYEGSEGMMVLASHRPSNKGRPDIRDRDGKTPLTAADGKPYSGCYVNAVVELWGQKGDNPGMRCALIGMQFSGDGDAFSGGSVIEDGDFEDLGDDADDSMV